ncbi:LssY C-terminal domain-containing protein [Desulfoferrobacter suflitae]|uniref:LssY C-terminal domain-containing protein n=1 Tax=Desulfoferrobacter suflitae TaxID=2865782 RepID=UPI002164BD93|nr:LssY C-terminal domain-containing protein [Desulfoferrobacter suflitae]MCK8601388.1 LssY C-terminal domain-containing protein [Desulfoferrobacter suflitae]
MTTPDNRQFVACSQSSNGLSAGKCLMVSFCWVVFALLTGCVSYRPVPLEQTLFRSDLSTCTNDKISVAATVLSSEQCRRVFGADLYSQGIQPVWLEIENKSDAMLVFFERSVDPHYYSHMEAAQKAHISVWRPFFEHGTFSVLLWPLLPLAPIRAASASAANRDMDEYFDDVGIGNEALSPGERAEGFVFTHVDAGTKKVPVRLVGADQKYTCTLFLKVPGTLVDHDLVEFESIYRDDEYIEHDWQSFVRRLATVPCCTTNAKGTQQGDPVNLVIIGALDDVLQAFTLAGWDETEPLSLSTSWQTARSFLNGTSYRTSPVSNLYLFDRRQDFALQKARDTINARNHLRLWRSPWRLEGKPVWLGQVSRDIGVRPTLKTWNLTTHRIDPDVDDSRDNVLGDLVESGRVSLVGFFRGNHQRRREAPGFNLTGDLYYTDGELLIMVIEPDETVLQVFDWHARAAKKPPRQDE